MGITLVPENADYGARIGLRGRKVIIECDTVASARAVRRQVVDLITGDETAPRIGFQTGEE